MRRNKSARQSARKERRQSGKQRRRELRRKAFKVASNLATGGIPAMRNVVRKLKANKRKMKKFVEEAGVEPSENLSELAVQTANVRAEKIQDMVEDNENYPEIQDVESAEEQFEEEQEQGATEFEDEFDGENDYFTSDALATIVGTAKGVVNKIKEGRLKKGKKFLGKTAEQWKAKKGKGLSVDVDSDGLRIGGLVNEKSTDVLSSAVGSAKSEAITTNLRKYLPFILIGIAFFFFGKKMFK